MPRLPLHPSSGTGIVTPFIKSIRLVRYGCTNRPFYHVVVMEVSHPNFLSTISFSTLSLLFDLCIFGVIFVIVRKFTLLYDLKKEEAEERKEGKM